MFKKDERFRFFLCKKTNSADARNIAINNSKGAILAFIDDDCIANKFWLERIAQQFEDIHCQIVMGKAVNGQNPNIFTAIENARINYYTQSNIVTKKKKKYAYVLDTKNFALRKSLLTRYNLLFDTRFKNKFEDVDFGFRIMSSGASILYNPLITIRHFGTSNLLSHVIREFWIGYNYCVIKSKWKKRFKIGITKKLLFPKTETNLEPKSYILLEWIDTLFRLMGCAWYRFDRFS